MPLLSADCTSNDSAVPDGKIDDCVHIDLDQVAEFTGATHLMWNCPEDENGTITGSFEGVVKTLTLEIKGWIIGVLQSPGKDNGERTSVGIKGCLRPWRRVDISQVVRGQAIGGITVLVQVPSPGAGCSQITEFLLGFK
jgi:hypothetical protein